MHELKVRNFLFPFEHCLKTFFLLFVVFSEHKDRIAIPDNCIRSKLKDWVQGKLSKSGILEVEKLLERTYRPIHIVFKWVRDTFALQPVPVAIKNIFQCVSSCSPVCSYVFPSDFALSLAESLWEGNVKGNSELMKSIQEELPLFFSVLCCLKIETCLPEEWKGLLLYLIDLAKAPFVSAGEVKTPSVDQVQDRNEW